MPDPTNKQSQIKHKLSEYLTLETRKFYPDIDWLYYYQEHDTTMSPRGAIFVDRISRKVQYPLNIDTTEKQYKIHLRLKISRSTLLELLDALDNWEEELNDVILKKLQCNGYDGYFEGIHPDPDQPSVIEVNKNQDDGGKGNLHIFLLWNDMGRISGAKIGAFL